MRDIQLLLRAVPRQLDHRQPLAHRRGDPARIGRRRDPQHVAQIERHVEVRVPERATALRVEHIEQHAGGLVVHPVDPLEDEDQVVDARLAQALDDAPGDAVFNPVEQALGVLPAQHHLHAGAPERRRRGSRQRRLPGARRAGQTRNQRRGRGRAHHQRQRSPGSRHATAVARAFDRQQAAALRAGRQRLDQARPGPTVTAVRALQRQRHPRRVPPRRRPPTPRQAQHALRPVHHLPDRPRRERPPELATQRLADTAGQVDPTEGLEHLLEARVGRAQRAERFRHRTVRSPVPPRRRRRVGGRTQQTERLGLVHHPRTAA